MTLPNWRGRGSRRPSRAAFRAAGARWYNPAAHSSFRRRRPGRRGRPAVGPGRPPRARGPWRRWRFPSVRLQRQPGSASPEDSPGPEAPARGGAVPRLEAVMTGDTRREPLTFLFADLESSTRLWERFPDAMPGALERHDEILRAAVADANGTLLKATGDGLMAVLSSASDGVLACLEAQRRLGGEAWGATGPLRVRMGLHVGEAQERAGDFFGPSVNRAARIMSAGHGGQVLLSARAADLARGRLPAEASLRDLGEHRLKDLSRPEHIFQLVHPALQSEFPPLMTLTHRPNNLPAPTSLFLGREAQLAMLRDLLDSGDLRLVTLTGPGGIGKTRLALQAAADQIDRFEDGVFFVDLSSIREPDAALAAIVRCLGLTPHGGEPPLETLTRELRDRQLLLLLDNLEQVVAAAEGIVDLLEHCSRLVVLVTSREALRVRGERLFPVPPLSLPAGSTTQASADAVAESEAVRLFVERAHDASPGFVLTDDNAAAVVESCSRLDGLPLAIELAAARLHLFSPSELNERLGDRLDFLTGPRDLPTRQQTLRSTIVWRYELLDADERALFELVSLFFPARVRTVEDVAARLEPLEHVDVVAALASLVDKSLLRSLNGDHPHLDMFDTIREYAVERRDLGAELAASAKEAHAEYFSEAARERNLDELAAELDNLQAAWSYWVGRGDLERLHGLLDPLWALLEARGRYQAAVALTDDLLGVLESVAPSPERTYEEIVLRTSLARGLMAIRGYTEEVDEAYGRALDLSEAAGSVPKRFPVLRSLATLHIHRGEFEQAAAVGRELQDLAAQGNDPTVSVEANVVLGSSLAFLGDVPQGLDHLERAIAQFVPEQQGPGGLRLGPSSGVVARNASAVLLWLQGYPDRAREQATNAIELARMLGHPFTLAYALFHAALIDLWRRDFDLATERSVGALDVAEEHDYRVWAALALAFHGAALVGLGRTAEGLERTHRGIACYQRLD